MKVQLIDQQNNHNHKWFNYYPIVPRQGDFIGCKKHIYQVDRVVLRSCSKSFEINDDQPELTGVVAIVFCRYFPVQPSK